MQEEVTRGAVTLIVDGAKLRWQSWNSRPEVVSPFP